MSNGDSGEPQFLYFVVVISQCLSLVNMVKATFLGNCSTFFQAGIGLCRVYLVSDLSYNFWCLFLSAVVKIVKTTFLEFAALLAWWEAGVW